MTRLGINDTGTRAGIQTFTATLIPLDLKCQQKTHVLYFTEAHNI
jgi:hypothetical protein